MFEEVIEMITSNDEKPSQEIDLQGENLVNRARLTGCVTQEEILNQLGNCKGLQKLVHSIGIVIKIDSESYDHINVMLHGKNASGTVLSLSCPTDGTEKVFHLDDHGSQFNLFKKLKFECKHPGAKASVSVKLYLHEEYKVPVISNEAVAFNTEEYKAMIKKSLLSKGNNKRLKEVIEKAENGEDVTIAFIGGSITQGAVAEPIHTNCYAYQTYKRFKQMFGKGEGENIHFVKGGVGGTPSELGVVRYHRDILKEGTVEPDIVIVEFAVNDADDETEGVCYESLCLQILSANNNPAVVLLFSVFVNDWNLQERLSRVGKHYDLPMVSIKDAVVDQFRLTRDEGNIISKRQFFADIYHPTNDGHTIMADCLAYLFSETKKTQINKDDINISVDPVIGDAFKNIRLLDRKNYLSMAMIDMGSFIETDEDIQMVEMDDNLFSTPQFPNNWMHATTSGNNSFTMKINSKSLILIYKDSGSDAFGKADIFVDGQLMKCVDPREINWTHCHAVILYQEEECKEHFVEIKMASDDVDKHFTILGFGYTL
ncbi:SGNH/GDSL hydrolase family protein [Aquibacillus koreensis]|uniref:SGNH/GDSL hydrolase family protein n=2 Tax=Aquibacillus koreensis TaxID=279446 RepID=A0A9X3WNS5_9BACI|nr:SGNH/GDSL hydrolase family protein [Aquibacillus koreensis]MCT2536870.1 SGNH/GDSL hydrolase family protein [Aquibacillus koreensis]MDC3421998.1 SGNH/GDSL hydrolase family protein [Aquibacillus koreensis]